MSDFTRFRRSSRMLAFRHLFPEIVAPWLQFRRLLLRVIWFWTLPVDRLLDGLKSAFTWPFRALGAVTFAALEGIAEAFTEFADLIRSLSEAARRWCLRVFDWTADLRHAFRNLHHAICTLGQIPVWSAAALAGTFGIMLTILLFLFVSMPQEPVVASIGPNSKSLQRDDAVSPTLPQPLIDFSRSPAVSAESSGTSLSPFTTSPAAPVPEMQLPSLVTSFHRMRLPFDWDPTRTFHVVSTPTVRRDRSSPSQLAAFSVQDGWKRAQPLSLPPASTFVPYIERTGVIQLTAVEEWIAPRESIGISTTSLTQRLPKLHIEKFVPRQSRLGEPLHYELLVENCGSEPLDDVIVREHVPELDRISNVRPPARIVDGELNWSLARLEPGEQRRLAIELRPQHVAPILQTTRVGVTTQVAATTQVEAPPAETPEPPTTVSEDPLESDSNPFMFLSDDEDASPHEPEPTPVLPPQRPVLPGRSSPPPLDTIPAETLDAQETTPPSDHTLADVEQQRPFDLEFTARSVDWALPGGEVWTVFEVHNRGTADAVDLLLQVRLSAELDYEHGRTLEHQIRQIPAQSTYRTLLRATAVREGTGSVQATLTDLHRIDQQAQSTCQIRPKREPSSGLVPAPAPFGSCSCGI